MVLYLDTDSFLTIKKAHQMTQGETAVSGDTSLGDYKEVAGVLFPFSVETKGQGVPTTLCSFSKIELNVPLDDSIFKMPVKAPATP